MRVEKLVIHGVGFVMHSPWKPAGDLLPQNIPACWWRFMSYEGLTCTQGYPQGGRNIR